MTAGERATGFAAVIPGAGAGTRFGGPKAAAELRPGERFIDAIARTAADAGAKPVVVVLPPGVAAPPGTRVVVNPRADSEQIDSVRLGFAQLTNSPVTGALLWPVDHPFVRLDTVLAIADEARRSGAPVVVPTHHGRRGHPAYFARESWRELVTVSEGGARAVVRGFGAAVREVATDDAGVLRDIDTRDDLAPAQAGRPVPGPDAVP
jgi:molybdenum cofactor cytidylyltransferase